VQRLPGHFSPLGAQRRNGNAVQLDWRPPEPSLVVPYAPAVVHLDEGVWMLSAVIGCEPADLHDGMQLAVEFHPASDEITLPYFAPAGGAAGGAA
jgi:hypothetical protein